MIRRRYRCPACKCEFDYDHHPSIAADPVPSLCPNAKCGYDTDTGEFQVGLTAPILAKEVNKIPEANYRAAEEGSIYRAQHAEEVLGLDREAANQIKITNMRDNLREGDVAAMPAPTPVSDFMQANPNAGGFNYGAANYAEHSSAVTQGPFPNAGARAMADVRQAHARLLANSGHAGAVTSSMPALETMAPGYRPRVR